MRPRLVALFVVLALAFVVSACGGAGSPTQPSIPTPPSSQVVSPAPVAGTHVHSFALPGTNEPLLVWFTNLSPQSNGAVGVGQRVTAEFSCGGPSGYQVVILAEFLSNGVSARTGLPVDVSEIAGSVTRVGPRCNAGGGKLLDVTESSVLPITHILLRVWSTKGEFEWLPRPAAVSEEIYQVAKAQ